MSERRIAASGADGALPATAAEAVDALKALVMGEADALVVETAQGPRVYTLRDASEPYRKLIERMSQAAVILSDGIVVYCNGALARALGLDTAFGARIADLVAAEDAERFDAFLRAGAVAPQACEAALLKRDGSRLPARMTAAPLSFDGLVCLALVVTPLAEIDSWRAAQAELVERERRFTLALGASPIVVFEQDLDLRYTWIFNPKLGYRAADVLGRTDAELMDPAYAPRLEAIKRKVIATGEAIRAEVDTAAPGGPVETYDLFVEPRRDAAGAIVGVTAVATEITQRKKAEEALRESETHFRLLTEASANVIFRVSANWRELRQLNGAGFLANVDNVDLPDDAWREKFIPGEDRPRLDAEIADAIARKGLFELEHRVIRADGGVGWVLSRAAPMFDARGEITEWFGAAADVTARKQAEEDLRDSEARKAFLLELSDALKALDDADAIVTLAAERLGRRLNADQVTFAEVDSGVQFITVAREWSRDASPSRVRTYRLEDFAALAGDLRAGKCIVAEHIASDPRFQRLRELYPAAPLGSLLGVPFLNNGRLSWILAVHGREARRWSAAETGLVEEVAERTWAWVERARAELALREGEQRLSDAQARAGIGTWWWEVATGRTQFNSCYDQLYGLTSQRPHDFDAFLALVHPDDRAGLVARVEEALGGGGPYEYEYRLRRADDGAERWFVTRAQAMPGEDGRPAVLSGIVQDITDRKHAELALRESEERYRALHEGLRDGYASVSMDGAITDFNSVYRDMLGYAPDELRALTYNDLTPERWRAFEEDIVRMQVLWRGFSDLYEKEYIRKDGSVIPVELRTVLMRDALGKPIAMWALVRDISARKQAETVLALAKAEAERANLDKSRFLAAASHDLRQPVQSLMLLLPLVERHIQPTPKAAQVLGLMGKALGGLNVLLTAVLDVSRLDAGGVEPSPEVIPLRGLCERLAAEYAPKAAAVGLDMRARTLDSYVRTDPALLERVLRNLLENALRYTPAGGLLLAMRRRGGRVRIDVIDTGVGIPADKRQDIFKEFTQLHNPGRDLSRGLGLGLAIVARLSALLGLDVAVASRPGRGSRFSISLPVVEPAAPKPAIPDETGRQSGVVLVIEDNQILRLAIETILNDCGYDTLAAASGEEAIDLAGTGAIDAIVTDYRLGAGLNGVEAVREIERRLGRKSPKLLLTGETANPRLDATDISDFEFLYKPISVEKLQAKLAAMLQDQD